MFKMKNIMINNKIIIKYVYIFFNEVIYIFNYSICDIDIGRIRDFRLFVGIYLV